MDGVDAQRPERAQRRGPGTAVLVASSTCGALAIPAGEARRQRVGEASPPRARYSAEPDEPNVERAMVAGGGVAVGRRPGGRS